MYLDYFSLNRHPFRITPDPSLFFAGGQDGRGVILNALIYGINSGEGILKVVGEVGSGKTMLCRMLEEELPDSVEIVYIANPSLSAREILYAIAIELKLEVSSSTERLKVLHLIQDYLLAKHGQGGSVVVFIEEAQSMPLETLEEIRLLSNLETHQNKLMQIVLFGQPELDKILAQKNIRQLRERITHSFSLVPLSAEATSEYIQYRLNVAGCPWNQLFSPRAEKMIAKASSGLTRRVNILADKSLLAAYADSPSRQPSQDGGEPLVLPRHVKAAIKDSDYSSNSLSPWLFGGLGFAVVIVLSAFLIYSEFWKGTVIEMPINAANQDIEEPTGNFSNQIVQNQSTAEPAVIEGNSIARTARIESVEGRIIREPEIIPEEGLLVDETSSEPVVDVAEDVRVNVREDERDELTEADDQSLAISEPLVATETVSTNEASVERRMEEVAVTTTEENVIGEVATANVIPQNEELEEVLEPVAIASSINTVNGDSPGNLESAVTVEASVNVEEPAINESAQEIANVDSATGSIDREELPVIVLLESETPEEVLPAAPVSMVPSGLAELRMQPTAEWLRSLNSKSGYSLVLFSVPSTNPNGLEEYLQFLQLVAMLDETYICFMPISSPTSGRWQVMHKEFEGVTPARNYINSLPVYVRQYDPYVSNLGRIQCSYPVETGN